SPRDFAAGCIGIYLHSLLPAFNALLRLTTHHNDAVEPASQSCLEQQSRLEHDNRIRLACADLLHALFVSLNDPRMQETVKLVNPWASLVKGQLSQLAAIHGFVRIENLVAKALDDFVINGLAWRHQFMANLVGINDVRAKLGKHAGDQRFSCCDAASESNFEHTFL